MHLPNFLVEHPHGDGSSDNEDEQKEEGQLPGAAGYTRSLLNLVGLFLHYVLQLAVQGHLHVGELAVHHAVHLALNAGQPRMDRLTDSLCSKHNLNKSFLWK